MTPDVKVKDYYLHYIKNAKQDIEDYGNDITEIENDIVELHSYIEKHKEELLRDYDINLDLYPIEWTKCSYDKNSKLYKLVLKHFNNSIDLPARTSLIQLMKYVSKLQEKERIYRVLEILHRRSNLTYSEYRSYITKFYNKVQEMLLEGFGYRYRGGIGTILINYWKVPIHNSIKYTDYMKTKRKKQEIINAGLKPYNEEDAQWYKEHGLEYDGVPYIVKKTNDHYCEITIVDSQLFVPKSMQFDKTQYIHTNLKGKTLEQIGDEFVKTKEDLYNLPMSLTYKVNIMLYKFPNSYLNLIRNADAQKYQY